MKYNWSIIGHEKQLTQIEQDLVSGNLASAYLLAGPNSIGKSTVAKKLAGILQCENDFCHKCGTCIQIEKGHHFDTIELSNNGESIKIEDTRKIIEHLNMTRQARYKILLIQELERMTIEAANSFLKTLEEPPERTVFIMTTNNIRQILPTVVSRVRVIKFNSVSSAYLVAKLKELYPESDKETINKVSLFSMGKTGKAVHLMESPETLANYLRIYNNIQNFLDRKNIADCFLYIEDLIADDPQIEIFFDILTHVLRSKILERTTNPPRRGQADTENCVKLLSKIGEAAILLKKNVNCRLVLESLMLQL